MSARDMIHVATVLTPGALKRQVAAEFGFTAADMEGHSRNAEVVAARDAAIARMHEAFPRMSLPMIAAQFGARDHTTIIHSLRRSQAGRYGNCEARKRWPQSERRPRFAPKPFDRAEARRLYLEELESLVRVGERLGVRKERIRLCLEEHELRRGGLGNRRMSVIKKASLPPQPDPRKALSDAEASIWHLIDIKRAGHTTAEYRANCEISELNDMRERRGLGRQARVTVSRGQEGSWMGSPAALCAV